MTNVERVEEMIGLLNMSLVDAKKVDDGNRTAAKRLRKNLHEFRKMAFDARVGVLIGFEK